MRCGGWPLASPTPILTDGSRKWTGTSWRVNVGHMQQRHVADGIEPEELVLRQPLLRHRPREGRAAKHRRGRGADLQDIAAIEHVRDFD